MTTIISVLNQKGGVGKTTSVYNLSAALAKKGKKVLMIDSDSQASLTLMTGNDPLSFKHTIVDVYENSQAIYNSVYGLNIENLFLVPSVIKLAHMDARLMAMAFGRENRLKKAVALIKDKFDYIFVDCPPTLGILTINSLIASDYVVSPCETSPLSVYALDDLVNTINDLKELNSKLKFGGVIATRYTKTTNTDKACLKELEENYKVLGIVKNSVAAKAGIDSGLPCVIAEPNSDVAKSYIEIAEKIEKGDKLK